ncbi:MAG: hypothetical protein VX278_10450, partial [Myxococcota bacterium]|nr:hypothetical protein [Myxococcota bacterium]
SVMIEDSPPEIEIIEILSADESGDLISVQTVYNDESLQCEAQAYDADGDACTLLYSWFFYQDMWYELESGSSTFSPVPSIVQPGARLYCGVIDTEAEVGDTVYQVVDVLNRDPEISSAGIDSLAGRAIGSEITCQAIVNDPDQSDVEIQYKWYNDGPSTNAPSLGSGTLIVQEFAEESSLLLTTEIASKGDQVSCLVAAFDEHGGSAESSVSIEVDNTAPEINEDGVVVLPISPFTNDDITCSAVAEDVDGDAITYTYAWYLNGQSVNHSGATLSAQTFGPFQANPTADQIRCDVTPIDSSGATGLMQRTTVTIQDSPPETTAVTIVNVEAETFTDSTIVAEAEGYDADGDDVQFRYRWHVNGALLPGLQEYNSLTGDYFNKDDVVYVEVRSYTEDVLSQTLTMGTALTSQSITIQNSLPPAPEIAFIAGDYTESANTAQCTLVSPSVDPDGDSVNYTFEIEKNNQPVTYLTSTTYTNDTLHWMDTVTGDELSCFVVANDGESESDVATTSTIVTECEYQDIYDVDVGFSDLGDIQNCWQGGSMTGAMFFSGIIDAPHTFYDENYEGDGLDILSYVGIDEDSPMIARNMSTVPVILAGATLLPDMLAVTPSKDGVFNDRHAYIRWKAPLDGTCDIFYELTGISLDGTTVEVVLYAMTQKRLRPASQLQSFGLYTTQLDVVNVLGYQTPYIFEGNLANNGVISVNVSAGDLIFLLQRNDSGAHLVYPNADEDWMSITGAIACNFE